MVLYLSMVPSQGMRERLNTAKTACWIAWTILLLTIVGGPCLLKSIGIAMEAFSIGSGLLFVVVGFSMLRAEDPEIATENETPKSSGAKKGHWDISIVPLSVPIIAGPGLIGEILATRVALESIADYGLCVAAISAVVLSIYGLLFVTAQCIRWFPSVALKLIFRLSGLFLVAMGIQLVMNGYRGTELCAHLSSAPYIISML
jgi:multiple antibiotic resistance protein